MTTGKLLRDLAASRGLSRHEIARRTGYDYRDVSKWFSDTRTPTTARALLALACALAEEGREPVILFDLCAHVIQDLGGPKTLSDNLIDLG
jgi:transcriptional regulator with XRE-family HTH domain